MPIAKRRPGGYKVDRTATTRMMSQHRLSCRVPIITAIDKVSDLKLTLPFKPRVSVKWTQHFMLDEAE